MKRVIVWLVVLAVIAGAAFFGYGAFAGANAKPSPAPVAQASPAPSTIVSAEGTVAPVTHTTLAFKAAGLISTIPVHEGDFVKQGTVLARLDDSVIQEQIANAEAQLTTAQAQLAASESQVHLAEKQLTELKVGGTDADIAAAQAAVSAAQAEYAKVKQGPTADQLGSLKANLDDAKAAVDQAQSAYDRAGGASNPYIQQTRESLQLQQATNAYIAALAAYNDARTHPTASELAAAASQIQQAQGTLARLTPTQQALEVAQAQVDAAQSQHSVAQTQVSAAQTALDIVKAQAADLVLVAPFDGTVVDRQVEVGEVMSPGGPAFTFADLSKLQIETTDLVEVDVARVSVGETANVKLDAFPDRNFVGQVERIALQANDHQGDKVYRVTIDLPDDSAASLRWGMTANVEIETGQAVSAAK
jgi:multidrug efflux pump subunit AcrA (membrane-fusion protein)